EWTDKPLRYTVKGNPYVSRMRKSDFQNPDHTWK
ncbi:3-methyladenine DNA glycosylase, partial [Staphylococcus aureus]|nr:3-methyladenine DNA glycosylase [Staphylococcus aureus]